MWRILPGLVANRVRRENQHPRYAAFIARSPSTAFGHSSVGSSLILKNAVGESIRTYCILDSDYHTSKEIQDRLKEARDRGVQLHIWKRKEIENYLLVPSAIQRIVLAGVQPGKAGPSTKEVEEQLGSIADALKLAVSDAIANHLFLQDRARGLTPANQKSREIVDEAWASPVSKLSIVSGKEVLSGLSAWSTKTYGVSFSGKRVAQELTRDEVAVEVIEVMAAIEEGRPFPNMRVGKQT